MNCRTLKRAQRRWARGRGIEVCAGGYTANLEDNLLAPMHPATFAEFAANGGHELRPVVRGGRPKLHALHSSSALACNLFDHWRAHDPAVPCRALGLDGKASLRFEAPYATGLPGEAPRLDAVLGGTGGATVAIECKFTEPFRQRRRGPPFRERYFPGGEPVWRRHGLVRAARLADALQSGRAGYRHLDAAQLLKHALGLTVSAPGAFALVYLYVPAGAADARHRAELERFADALGGEFDFLALDVPTLLERLGEAAGAGHRAYFDYVTGRYAAT